MTRGSRHSCARCRGGDDVQRVEVPGWANTMTREFLCVMCRISLRVQGVEVEFID